MLGLRGGAPLKAQKGTRVSFICCCTVIASSSSTSYTVGTCGNGSRRRSAGLGHPVQTTPTMNRLPPEFHEELLCFACAHTLKIRRLCRHAIDMRL